MKNIFTNIREQIPDEIFEELVKTEHCKIERIISRGHSTADDYWYDQAKNEWVIILKGSAGFLLEGNSKVVVMKPGDYINIPAHRRHRVEWTDPDEETIWLAIHY